MAESKIIISLPKEFSYEHALSFLKRSPQELLHQVKDDSVFKALLIQDQCYVIKIDYEPHELQIRFLNEPASSNHQSWISHYIREWFDLDTDLRPFYQLASKDGLLKDLIDRYYGYRIIGQPDLFESLVWAVLGQQINLTFAYTLKGRFVEKYGSAIEVGGARYFLFPSPEVVKEISFEALLALQFSRQKALYILGIAQAFCDGSLSRDHLKSLSFQDAKEALMKMKGIGNWTANYVLMKTFRYPDAFPLEDAGVHNAIRNLKKMKSKPKLDQVKRIFKKYKGWEAYATLYLWKSL